MEVEGRAKRVLLLKLEERETGWERAVFEGDGKRLDVDGVGDEGRASRDGGVEADDAVCHTRASVLKACCGVVEFQSKVKKWK